MRILNLIKGDIKFQFKYGFYFLYLILIILYLLALSLLKGSVREATALIMIFSDPASMGLFFMGAMVLLEKNEHITNSFAISPVSVTEYMLSKVVSIGLISILAGSILALYSMKINVFVCILMLFAASVFFTLCGLIVGANIRSMNQYVLATVPFEIISFLPMITYLLGIRSTLWNLHPCYAIIDLLSGNFKQIPLKLISILLWNLIAWYFAKSSVDKMFQRLGGVRL